MVEHRSTVILCSAVAWFRIKFNEMDTGVGPRPTMNIPKTSMTSR